jgi:hypothetical protein
MGFSVRERGDIVATFRHIAVHLMETLASWVPTTPEMEVKVLFGRHLWDFAQHADALGRRTAELRMAPHASRAPRPELQAALDEVRRTQSTEARLGRMYQGLLPLVEGSYRAYLAGTDHLMDEPTVRILEHALLDTGRMLREHEQLLAEGPVTRADADGMAGLAARFARLEQVVDPRPPAGEG